jgi:hypothetical protein
MNQQLIDKLLHKSGARFGAEGIDYSSFTSSKFAELIVKECARVAFATAIGDGSPDEIHDAIKETFRS